MHRSHSITIIRPPLTLDNGNTCSSLPKFYPVDSLQEPTQNSPYWFGHIDLKLWLLGNWEHRSKTWTHNSIIPKGTHKQAFYQPISQTVASKQWSPQNLASSHPDPSSQSQNSGDPSSTPESVPFTDPFPFHLPGMFKQLTPLECVQRNFQQLGNPTVPLLGQGKPSMSG